MYIKAVHQTMTMIQIFIGLFLEEFKMILWSSYLICGSSSGNSSGRGSGNGNNGSQTGSKPSNANNVDTCKVISHGETVQKFTYYIYIYWRYYWQNHWSINYLDFWR